MHVMNINQEKLRFLLILFGNILKFKPTLNALPEKKMTSMPTFIYGTAWKKAATTNLVKQAVEQGFKAIDTGNQPKHYSEKLVGDAVKSLEQQGIKREQLFLQTKFTPLDGHDDRVPYDPSSSLRKQVATSFESSLVH